ncbi:MAG: cysteine hydrolase family protein [Candidatus Cryosericum sp.]
MNATDVAMLVIDMQQDFLSPVSPLFVAGGPAIVPDLQRALEAARSANESIVHVTRRHRATGIDVDLSRRALFAEVGGFLVVGTRGAEEVPQLAPVPGDLVVTKTRWSAFFATDLDTLLRRLSIHRLVLTGVQTPNCIRATANDALSLDYATTVLADATASQNDEIQQSNLRDMAAMGVEVTTVSQFRQSLGL